MAKQGNSDNGRKGTNKRTGTQRARGRPVGTEHPPVEAPPSAPDLAPAVSSPEARRRRATPAQPRAASRAKAPRVAVPRRGVDKRAASTPEPDAPERPPQVGTRPEDDTILPVEVVDAATEPAPADTGGAQPPAERRSRERVGPRSNALGGLIERRFSDPTSPVRSYSELERRSHISREALSRYVTPRADRRRSPTIDTLAAIAEAMHLSLEQVCRAAVAAAHGVGLPEETVVQARDELFGPLIAGLTASQFAAVIELLRQMQIPTNLE